MRKAWCDMCGTEFPNPDETEIGKIRMDSAYSGDIEGKPLHINFDVCKCCLCYVTSVIKEYKKAETTQKGAF